MTVDADLATLRAFGGSHDDCGEEDCVDCSLMGGHMAAPDYSELRATLERLNDPETRFELGEDARRAHLAALADRYLLELLDGYERLERLLVPKAVS